MINITLHSPYNTRQTQFPWFNSPPRPGPKKSVCASYDILEDKWTGGSEIDIILLFWDVGNSQKKPHGLTTRSRQLQVRRTSQNSRHQIHRRKSSSPLPFDLVLRHHPHLNLRHHPQHVGLRLLPPHDRITWNRPLLRLSPTRRSSGRSLRALHYEQIQPQVNL